MSVPSNVFNISVSKDNKNIIEQKVNKTIVDQQSKSNKRWDIWTQRGCWPLQHNLLSYSMTYLNQIINTGSKWSSSKTRWVVRL